MGGGYFNHHYLIDYVIAWAYLLLAFMVIERAVMPRLDRAMDYNLLPANESPSGSTSTNARRRRPAKRIRGRPSRQYLRTTPFVAKVLRTIGSTCDGLSTGPIGEKKAIKYFVIFIFISLSLVILRHSLSVGLGEAEIVYNRGVYLQLQEQQEEAISQFDEAIQLDPRHVAAYNNRGIAYQNLGQYDRAIRDYDEAIRLNPQNTMTYNNRGSVYHTLGQHRRAVQDYDEAIRLSPQLAAAYNNRGGAYARLGQAANAKADQEKACQLDKQYC